MALADAAAHFDLSLVCGLSSARGRDLLARLAARLGAPLALDCVGLDADAEAGAVTVTKSHFSGKTLATLKLEGPMAVCGLRPNVIEAFAAPCTAELVTYAAAVEDSGRLKLKAVKQADSGTIDLTEANRIITGGRPIGSAENFSILQECAGQLKAAVGASRAAVDAGFAPHAMQVGQTGKTVSPKLYIACGLSGSVQHFAGMKTSKVIVAINTDRDAPIFGKCDYGIVGDLFEVVPVLTDVLKGAE